jgi:hypothetical protein
MVSSAVTITIIPVIQISTQTHYRFDKQNDSNHL